ncbi:MAG: sugar phosphate isomerase/epimerase [Gemmatimonadota bacterium]|nr:sugar phosphate isomerase/epimerase [Gemmatimonadota bacterium]
MKIGITQIILGNMSLEDTLRLCEDAGYQAVELVFAEGKGLDPNMSADEIAQVGQQCADAGVEIGSVIVWYQERGNLLSRDVGERERCLKCLRRSLEIAGALSVDGVLLHPGQLEVEGTYQQAWDGLRDALSDTASLAEEMGAAIGLENVWNKFLLSPREARLFVDEIGSEWVGIYLDTANMMAYGYPEHWIRELGARIKKVHFKDFRRGEHSFVNLLEGDTDWPAVMAELRAVGYDSTLIHEVGGSREELIDLGARMRQIVAL